MYEDAEKTLEQILGLVARCPEGVRDKCFEMLLQAYLDSKVVSAPASAPLPPVQTPAPPDGVIPPTAQSSANGLPDALKSRFAAAAGRLGVQMQQLAGLFDFQLDPYNYHALNVPGENKADKMRNVGLLLCAKSYLTMSGWDADWKEFRAVCIDQNCWDRANSNTHMSKSGFFKTVSAADGMVLNSSGVEAAETLLSQLILGEHAAVK